MDSGESGETPESSETNCQWVATSRKLWDTINDFIESRMSKLQDKKTEDQLKNWLNSMLSNKHTLKFVFAYPPIDEAETKQWSAFITWIFGALFKMINSYSNSDIIVEINKFQSTVLRVLSRFNPSDHQLITTKYMIILSDLTNFKEHYTVNEAIEVSVFTVENCIDGLNLKCYPVDLKVDNISYVQVVIMQMILESNMSAWDTKLLWETATKVIAVSDFNIRDYALAILVNVISLYPPSDSTRQYKEDVVMNYAEQIINILPGCNVPPETIDQYIQAFNNLIKIVSSKITTINFCIIVIDSIVSGNLQSAELMNTACSKIKTLLQKHKTFCDPLDIKKYVHYCDIHPKFVEVLIYYMFSDITSVVNQNSAVTVSSTSNIWTILKELIFTKLSKEKYDDCLIYFKALKLLKCWIQEYGMKVTFFNADDPLMDYIMNSIRSNTMSMNDLIFEIFIELIQFDELSVLNVDEIMASCWSESSHMPKFDSRLVVVAKSLSMPVKIKCLKEILTSSCAKKYLNLVNTCMANTNEDVLIAVIICCPYMLHNRIMSLTEIVDHCIQPAFARKSVKIHEAIAAVLGDFVCLTSNCGTLVRKSWDSIDMSIDCKYCDQNQNSDAFFESIIPQTVEKLLTPLLELVNSEFTEVRLKMSQNLKRLSNHMKVFNRNDITKLWVQYIDDKNENIRNNVANNMMIILQNKLNMLQVNKVILESNVPDELVQFVNIIIDKMLEVLIDVFTNCNHSVHATLLVTAKNFAWIPFHLTERRMLMMFLHTILQPVSSFSAIDFSIIAYQEISQQVYGFTPENMYVRYKTDFIKLIMQMAVHNYVSNSYNLATSLHRIAKCMGFQGSRQFLLRNWKYAVCYLLPCIAKESNATELISDLSNAIMMDKRDIIKRSFNLLYTHVNLSESPEVVKECLAMIETCTGERINDLIATSFDEGNLFPFILRLNENPEKVIKFLKLIFEVKGYERTSDNSWQYVVNNIAFSLHGILVCLDKTLRLNYDENKQKNALASLATFINLMGTTHIKKFRYMILTILRTAIGLKWSGFKKLCCNAFSAFINNIATEDLGPLLSTICISMIPLLEHCPRESNDILNYLIVINEKALSSYITELFFVDDLKISKYIADIIKHHIRLATPRNAGKHLEMWLKRIKHEVEEIRLKAFSHLQEFLMNHRNEINDLIFGDNEVHPTIVELIDALLTGCQDKQEAIRFASAECIGELGAVEPQLLPRRIITSDDSTFIENLNYQFARAALEELIRSLQSEKGSESNVFALAIQEILKTFHISPTETSGMWLSFPPTMQQIITPFLTSHYTSPKDENQFPHPIYGSEAGSSSELWTYNWVCSMSQNIQNPVFRELLSNCRLAFKRDIKIAIFFMPHIVVEIITQGSSNYSDKILEEMLAAIKVNETSTIDPNLLNYYPIRSEVNVINNNVRESDETRRVRCSQVVFRIFDHIQRWLIEQRLKKNSKYQAMLAFYNKVDFSVLAMASYHSYEYHRALLYLEQHMALKNKKLSESFEGELLAKIYTQLEESDGVIGILASQDHPTIQQQVLQHEVSGQFQDAASCYEILVKKITPNTKYLQGMIQCYIDLNHPFTAMNITQSVLQSRPELEPFLNDHEPFWQLAHYGMLDNLSDQSIKKTLLKDLKNGIKLDLSLPKKKLISLLRSPSHPGAYQESYSSVMKLHTLNEFEKAIEIMLDNVTNVPKIFEEWNKRGQLVRTTRGQEFLLSMRRMTLDLALKLYIEKKGSTNNVLEEEIGKLWLKSARIARKAGLYQQAYGYILSGSDSRPNQDMYIELAQLYWDKGCQEEAITTLKRCLMNFKPTSFYENLPSQELLEERKQCAKAKLYYAKYNDKTVSVQIESNIQNYNEALQVWKNWEKSCVAFAEYNESLVEKLSNKDKDISGGRFQESMITYYGRSLQYGCKYIHQSMPRMLTAWIDYASRLKENPPTNSDDPRKTTFLKMTRNIEVYVHRLPAFMWFTAFSQIVSRIGHPENEIQRTLSTILVKVISSYPQQSLWMMAAVYNTSYSTVNKVCNVILSDENLRSIVPLIRDFSRLWQRIIELSSRELANNASTVKVKDISPKLPKLLSSPGFSAIMIPTTKFLKLHLPAKGDSLQQHNPFPESWHQITGIRDNVTIMHSMQRPKKISLVGSDGKDYDFICKFKDDLRKDFRFMEFDHIVNKCLQNNPESCQRRLYIRTYSVIPLNEQCGMIEWVPNLIGLRPIITNLYREKGHQISMKNLLDKNDPIEKKKQVFRDVYLKNYPAVLGEWFRIRFPEAYGWYEARTAYIRTTAVMSMVGYVMGLGDRHGENINIDSKNGDCVHVDFNCLFNAGERLNWPERVPFRLTHNMIHAMGPLKLEGPFRKTCETTLRVLRENSRTLISVLTPFVYDPMVMWSKKSRTNSEMTNDNAVNDIKQIELRLKGIIRSQMNVLLNFSVEGQTNYLLLEATNINNLCQMFFGWGAFM